MISRFAPSDIAAAINDLFGHGHGPICRWDGRHFGDCFVTAMEIGDHHRDFDAHGYTLGMGFRRSRRHRAVARQTVPPSADSHGWRRGAFKMNRFGSSANCRRYGLNQDRGAVQQLKLGEMDCACSSRKSRGQRSRTTGTSAAIGGPAAGPGTDGKGIDGRRG